VYKRQKIFLPYIKRPHKEDWLVIMNK